jgi:hypothetical protein
VILKIFIFTFTIFIYVSNSIAETVWHSGPYLALNAQRAGFIANDTFNTRTTTGTKRYYQAEKDFSMGGKAGYSFDVYDKIFFGPEISFTPGTKLTSDDTSVGGKEDIISIQDNYNIGIKATYALGDALGLTTGIGKSFQKIKTFYDDSDPADNNGGDVQYNDKSGTYFNFGIIANLKGGYQLEFVQNINEINKTIDKIGTPGDRTDHTVTVDRIKSTTISLVKFF